jgi:hypothetical protein
MSVIYFCSHCKRIDHSIEEFLFVEEVPGRYFCSEHCIESHYEHLVEYFKNESDQFRLELKSQEDSIQSYLEDVEVMNSLLNGPDELWCETNKIGEKYFTFFKKFELEEDNFTGIGICYIYDSVPSFVLFATMTNNDEMIQRYRRGELIEDPSQVINCEGAKRTGEQSEEEESFIKELEGHRSELIADLLERRLPTDIPFEKFGLYESYINETLELPDQVYKTKQLLDLEMFIYTKAFDIDGVSFYYLVICLSAEDDGNVILSSEKEEDTSEDASSEDSEKLDEDEENLMHVLPILAFPTVDGALFKHYTEGSLIQGDLKN